MMRVATTSDVLYAPQFVAEGLGLFADHGVDVSFQVTGPGYGVLAAHGRLCDLYVGSMWFCIAWPDRDDPIMPVGLSNRNCHHVVVTRAEHPGTEWSSRLKGTTLLVPSDAPTPFAALVGALHELGLGLSDIRPVPGLGVDQVMLLFGSGLGDAAVLPAYEAIRTTGHVAGMLSEVTGPLPWTVFSAPRSVIEGKTAPHIAAFLRAIDAAQAWIGANSPAAVAGALRHRFTNDDLEAQVRALMSRRVWGESTRIILEDVRRWERILQDAGLVPPGSVGLVDLTVRGSELLGNVPSGEGTPREVRR